MPWRQQNEECAYAEGQQARDEGFRFGGHDRHRLFPARTNETERVAGNRIEAIRTEMIFYFNINPAVPGRQAAVATRKTFSFFSMQNEMRIDEKYSIWALHMGKTTAAPMVFRCWPQNFQKGLTIQDDMPIITTWKRFYFSGNGRGGCA
jgi:hypothetical protein